MIYSEEIVNSAKLLYLRRWKPREIAQQLSIGSERIIYYWIKKFQWDELISSEAPRQAISRRLCLLVDRESKSDDDYKEIDKLTNALLKLERIKENENNKRESSGRSKKKKRKVNDVSEITEKQLEATRKELFWGYQLNWHLHKSQRTRFILKSRQIGATFYFAYEAFEDAVITGENQIFISASRAQAEVFKAYIISFAKKYFDVELRGADVIVLSNGAELRFVSTNSRTAQGYHGHLYIDEVFWIPKFEEVNKVASGMAAHKHWRKTYFSTPSVKSHSAYEMWSGEKFSRDRKNCEAINLSYKDLGKGELGVDGIWRNVVTVIDAEQGGCDLFDIDELKREFTLAEFNNLFMCVFLEAGMSVFNLGQLLECAIDENKWLDFNSNRKRPYNSNPVWIGYDPARVGDRSSVCVLAPPIKDNDKFRVLEKLTLSGNWAYQAEKIRVLTEKYTVAYIGIDTTGIGHGVYESVREFYPNTYAIHYGLETKTRLVLKALDVVEYGRIEWDAKHRDIPQAFLQVRQTTTGNDKVTYIADRNSTTGHADIAWSIMHALYNEPLSRKQRTATIAIGGQ